MNFSWNNVQLQCAIVLLGWAEIIEILYSLQLWFKVVISTQSVSEWNNFVMSFENLHENRLISKNDPSPLSDALPESKQTQRTRKQCNSITILNVKINLDLMQFSIPNSIAIQS